ncbi:MAG: hypothetical protein KatS3mg055_2532 [Chloroflexus sp.]|uniref:hypothetical protein n=1 Tax=Chloroflexus sp. TaxID=1904827 RepID=UPI0021DD412A|nr:hypothetical protein [Chloroflexus sp.]GIV90014.1 MAG: hypothetical protein KatS3mg055_2532 [Chloroflexus sp.]
MTEPSGHCPYLGLKQNQAIRFASPTPEHRCYAAGQAQEIPQVEPDYQVRYCLSASHVRCPLYMGMPFPTTSTSAVPSTAPSPAAVVPSATTEASGLQAWLADLNPRDQLIYSSLLIVLVVVLMGYAFGGIAFVSSLLQPTGEPNGTQPAVSPTSLSPLTPTVPVPATASPTMTLTPSPTITPSPTATPYELIPVTNTPTMPIFIPPPPPPVIVPTDTPPPVLPPVEEPTAPPVDEPTPTAPPVDEPTPTAAPPVEEPTVPPVEGPTAPPADEPTPTAAPPVEEPTVPSVEGPTAPPADEPTPTAAPSP